MPATPVPLPAAGLWYGGDYNPEQWPESVWQEDVRLMRRAGVNLATVGVFSWSWLEPEEGRYTFGWLDRVLDLLADHGIGAALATPTASPPPWFGLAHPDALPVTAEGVRLSHGSRDTYCVCAPSYLAASTRIAAALADRYRGHPALALWHVHNEYGTWCHCEHVAAAFRDWLARRHGGLDALNDAWTTAFWSQRYASWEEVLPPRATQYRPNPAQALDFRRFLSDAMLAHFTAQRDVLRERAPGVPVTTNLAYGDWVPVDPWRWAEEVDLVAVDHYPDRPGSAAAEQTAFAADLARSWAGSRPWLLMEQAAGVVYAGGRTLAKRPGELLRHGAGHVARGSVGAMFFQWRASAGGAEQWHGGMVPHAGPASRVYGEVCGLGGLLSRLGEAREARVVAPVAVLWDPECWWALGAPHLPAPDLDYLEAVAQVHRVLWRAGWTADFVAPGARLAGYRAVVAPALYLASDRAAEALAAYVEGGGRLLATFLSGVADEHGRVRTGGYPGALRGLLGVRVTEFLPLEPDERVAVFAEGAAGPDGAEPSRYGAGRLWSEDVAVTGARAVARYASGVLADRPAITRKEHGAGTAWYLSTRLGDEGLSRLLAEVLGASGAQGAPPGVEVVRREPADGGPAWLFVLNHTELAHDLPLRRLGAAAGAVDAVSGARYPPEGGPVRIAPGGVLVLRARVDAEGSCHPEAGKPTVGASKRFDSGAPAGSHRPGRK
ncbi:beta-galactosidase [Allonocardiopsis opalescens]|uniref:Beta-galactosidase n=1 Tax=Allonocardiopsis opalescens TaxID=1144618 RepID=A0A2T0PX36_9ACTN|nr:beta-galactosidase [Allonocardiopsis opalescens]PRX96095.1 beta-galactosidase [Allonocardiopsis opalescens]